MELLEHQAKELFKMVEIPILPSQTIEDSRQIKQLQIPYPVVLKSQVRSGGRGKAGGVRFAANTIDAIAAARTIFKLSILGEYPEVILAEAHYNAEREFFLAVVLDYNLQRPVLLGSAAGGMNVDSLLKNLQQVVIEEDFSLFYARRLAAKMGLSGKLICSVSEIIAKMYRLFIEKDLDLIEINPLGVNTKGELMALDGKITINDRGFARQPDIKALSFSVRQKQTYQHNVFNAFSGSGQFKPAFALEEDLGVSSFPGLQRRSDPADVPSAKERAPMQGLRADAFRVKKSPTNAADFPSIPWRWLNWQNKTGKLAVVCNSWDLSLLTWDLLQEKKINPACGILIENNCQGEVDDLELYQETIRQIIAQIKNIKGIKAILLNIRITAAINEAIVATICDDCHSQEESTLAEQQQQSTSESNQSRSSKNQSVDSGATQPQFVLRLIGNHQSERALPNTVYLSNDLELAVKKAISIVKSS